MNEFETDVITLKTNLYSYFGNIFMGNFDTEDTRCFLSWFEKYAATFEKNDILEMLETLTEFENLDLNTEYTTSFLLGEKSVNLALSAYFGDGLMKSNTWKEIVGLYNNHGFKMAEDFKETEDHIAAVCFYLGKITDANDEEDYIIKKFLMPIKERIMQKLATISQEHGFMFYQSIFLLFYEYLEFCLELNGDLKEL